jgi:hypothetical protein
MTEPTRAASISARACSSGVSGDTQTGARCSSVRERACKAAFVVERQRVFRLHCALRFLQQAGNAAGAEVVELAAFFQQRVEIGGCQQVAEGIGCRDIAVGRAAPGQQRPQREHLAGCQLQHGVAFGGGARHGALLDDEQRIGRRVGGLQQRRVTRVISHRQVLHQPCQLVFPHRGKRRMLPQHLDRGAVKTVGERNDVAHGGGRGSG